MASETMTKAGPTRDAQAWWPRGAGGWGRAGHLGWRVLAVSVLVIVLVFPWGPVATADDVAPPAGPTAREAAEARDAVRAGELDVAQAEQELAGLRRELEDARIRVQSAAADHEDAVAALDAAEERVREARDAADEAGSAEARARAGLAAAYRAAQRAGAGSLGSLEVVLEAQDVDDLIEQEAVERAVGRKLAAALTRYSEARAASESADARWTAAREAHARARAEAEAAYQAAQRAVADLAARTEAAERDRTLLIERLAELRNTSIQIEREREEARAAEEQARREAEARAALEAARVEAEAAGEAGGVGTAPGAGSGKGGAGGADSGEGAGGGAGDGAPAPGGTGGGAGNGAPDPGLEPGPRPAPAPPAPAPPAPAPPAPVPPAPVPPPPVPDVPGSWVSTPEQGLAAVAWARTKIGSPYELGGSGPASYDCSGLTSEAWKHAGHWITRTSRSQYLAVAKVTYAELRPGDLLFYGTDMSDPKSIYHVAMYAGNGRMIEAVMPGVALRETDLRLTGAMPYASRP